MKTTAASTLAARAYLRLGAPDRALDALERDGDETREAGETALLRAVSASRVGMSEAAEARFTEARAFIISCGDTALEAELEFYLALDAFGSGDLEEARKRCAQSLDVAFALRQAESGPAAVPLSHIIARTQLLVGVVDAAQGRFRDEVGNARAALRTLDACPIPDVYESAFVVRNLAILARDFDFEDVATLARERTDSLTWTDDIAHVHFAATESLALCSALRGDVLTALRLLRRAGDVATCDPERIIVAVDRALVAREAGHHAQALEEIDFALDLADHYAWHRAPGDTRYALLALAQAAAPIVPARARAIASRYTAIENSMNGAYAARLQLRTRAEEAYTFGLLLRAEGRIAASRDRLRIAFDAWAGAGYEWRAARAALELVELDSGDVFKFAVARELQTRPDSIFAARARNVA